MVRVRLIINRDLGTERNRSVRDGGDVCAGKEMKQKQSDPTIERDGEESVGRSRRRRFVYLGAFQIHGELLHLFNFIHYMVTIFFFKKMMVSSSKALRGDFKTIVMRTKQEKCN